MWARPGALFFKLTYLFPHPDLTTGKFLGAATFTIKPSVAEKQKEKKTKAAPVEASCYHSDSAISVSVVACSFTPRYPISCSSSSSSLFSSAADWVRPPNSSSRPPVSLAVANVETLFHEFGHAMHAVLSSNCPPSFQAYCPGFVGAECAADYATFSWHPRHRSRLYRTSFHSHGKVNRPIRSTMIFSPAFSGSHFILLLLPTTRSISPLNHPYRRAHSSKLDETRCCA